MNRLEKINYAINWQRSHGSEKLAQILEAEVKRVPECWLLASSDNEEEEEIRRKSQLKQYRDEPSDKILSDGKLSPEENEEEVNA